VEKIGRFDDDSHHPAVISEQEASSGCKDRKDNIEQEAHLVQGPSVADHKYGEDQKPLNRKDFMDQPLALIQIRAWS
jgi:hypothetical protein